MCLAVPWRHRHIAAALALTAALIATPVALAGSSATSASSGAAAAVRLSHLWATINVCGPAGHPHLLGVRAQMPALSNPAHVSINIQVDYWNGAKQAFVPDPGVDFTAHLGVLKYGTEQGGALWRFKAATPNLRATVTFFWRRNGRQVATAMRHTSAGHHDADQAQPPGFSTGFCRLKASG